VIHVPFTFVRRCARKSVVRLDPSRSATRPNTHANDALITALARAFQWQELLETGVYGTVAEIAAAEGINDSYASRILRLTLLAPDVVEGILDGLRPHRLHLQQVLRPFPVEWTSQRRRLSHTL
jgi:hypothetical protein